MQCNAEVVRFCRYSLYHECVIFASVIEMKNRCSVFINLVYARVFEYYVWICLVLDDTVVEWWV